MRAILAVLTLAALPLAATAQPAPPVQATPGQAPAGAGRAITRDQFVQRAAEMAGRRFDQIDTNHTGTITRSQLHAFRQAHRGGAGLGGGQGVAPAE